MELTDEEIVEKIQTGDKELFGEVIDRYETKLRRYARKFLFVDDDASDLVQDVFIRAYENIQSFDTNKSLSPWLYRIAHNIFINEIKRKEKAATPWFHLDTLFPQPIAPERADSAADLTDIKHEIDTALATLTVDYREPLVLFYFEELSYKEIGSILGLPTATVGARINRAKAKLKKYIADNTQRNHV